MLPTQEEQDKKFEELYEKYKSAHKPMTWKVSKKYAKWYAEQVIKHCAEVAETTTKSILFDDPKEGRDAYIDIKIVDKQSITNVINEL